MATKYDFVLSCFSYYTCKDLPGVNKESVSVYLTWVAENTVEKVINPQVVEGPPLVIWVINAGWKFKIKQPT